MRGKRWMAGCFTLLAFGTAAAETDLWFKRERIDLQPGGAPSATRFAIASAAISDNGRWVVFTSAASDLVSGDSNGRSDVFVRDRSSGITRRVSLRPGAAQTTADSTASAISADARFIVFISADSQLVANDTNSVPDQFLLDRDSDADGIFDEAGATTLERVSLNNSGLGFFNGVKNVTGAVDDRGQWPIFATLQALASNDNNGRIDVYARDRAAGVTRVQSQSAADVAGNADSPDFFNPPLRISGSGAVVAFSSEASNLVADDTNGAVDIFVRNRDSDGNGVYDEAGGSSVVRANARADGSVVPFGSFAQFDLSADGRWLAFSGFNTSGTNPAGADIHLRNLVAGGISAVAFDAGQWAKGTASCCGNQSPLLARHARVVAFSSSQLYSFGAGVTGGRGDVFVKSRGRALTRLSDYPVPAAAADGYSSGVAALSRNGAYLLMAVAGAGSTPVPEEGYYVYQRDTIFVDGHEP